MAQEAPNTFAVRRVCLAPRGEGVQPAAKLFGPFDGISPVRSYCLSSLHNCVLTPYCTHGRATIYEFCDQIRHEERRHEGARVLTSQAAHAFSHVETAADTEMYPPTGALRLGRAAIIGFTGNIGHDMYINGGMLDAFATARADDKPFDAIILNVRDRFGDELQRWQDRWQWRVAEALFGVNYTRCTSLDGGGVGAAASRCLLPLRVPSLTCVDELVWKPPHLDFNPMSGTLRHVAAARAAVLGRYAIHRLPGCRTATCAPSVVFYTRGDAARRSLDLSGAALSQGWRERLGVTQILHRMPSAALAQFELFANADVIIAPHGASCGNAFLMRPGAIYIEISTLCPELCLNGCYPYASAGPKCSRRSLLDGAAYAGRGVPERLACEDALSMHGGAVPVYARAAGVYARTVFACVRGNACTDGHIAGSDNGPAAWKRDFHEEIVVDDGLIAKVAAAIAEARAMGGAAPSIVLFLVFDKELIRAKYKGKAEAAYEREFKRARQLLLSLRSVGTTLPVHIVVGGDRVPHKESRLTRLGARLLPIKERLKPPPWASEYYRNNFNKLLALNMTQFSTVIVLDNDCVVLRNIDHLAWAVKTPAVTCQPRRGFTLCSHNFGVHVVSPSTADAAALYESYQTRKRRNNGGEQEVWANFHKRAYELPIGYNAHRGMVMSDAEWRDVHIVHMISGYATNRMPDFVRDRMVAFDL